MRPCFAYFRAGVLAFFFFDEVAGACVRLFVRGTARATEGALPHCLTHCLTLAASVSVCFWLWRNIKLKRDQHGATQLGQWDVHGHCRFERC